MWITWFQMFLFTILLQLSVSESLNDEAKLIYHLFKNHSNQARPVKNGSEPIVVQLSFELIQIIAINERDQHITNKIWMHIEWTNELLKWNPKDWGGINSANISPEKLWVPDIVLYNEIDKALSEGTGKYKTRINIDSNGRQMWLTPLLTTSSCSIDVTDFPFDYQTCSMKFGSWSFDKSKIDMIKDNRPIVTSSYINSSEWMLLNTTKKVNEVKYSCCINPFMDITFTFHLKRKSLYYVFNLIGPCLISVIIILFSFFLPSNCVERISLIVTMLLAFVVFLQLINDYLPRNSDSTPCLSVYYMTVMVESACSLAATCIVILVHRNGSQDGARPVPEWVRRCIVRFPIKIQQTEAHCPIEKDVSSYEVTIHPVEAEGKLKNGISIDTMDSSIRFRNSPSIPSKNYTANNLSIKKKMLKEDCMSERDEIEIEWQTVAKCLDRAFFYIFLTLYITSFSVILLPAYFRK